MTATAPIKVVSLRELAGRIADNTSVAIGGSFLHRGPFALVRELVRMKKRGLEIIKPSPGYDVDLLCRAGAAAKVTVPASSRWKATSGSRAGSERQSSARRRASKNTLE